MGIDSFSRSHRLETARSFSNTHIKPSATPIAKVPDGEYRLQVADLGSKMDVVITQKAGKMTLKPLYRERIGSRIFQNNLGHAAKVNADGTFVFVPKGKDTSIGGSVTFEEGLLKVDLTTKFAVVREDRSVEGNLRISDGETRSWAGTATLFGHSWSPEAKSIRFPVMGERKFLFTKTGVEHEHAINARVELITDRADELFIRVPGALTGRDHKFVPVQPDGTIDYLHDNNNLTVVGRVTQNSIELTVQFEGEARRTTSTVSGCFVL